MHTFLKDAALLSRSKGPSEDPGCNGVDLAAYWRNSGTISPIPTSTVSLPEGCRTQRHLAAGDHTSETDPMGADDENFGSDADMQGGVVQSDAAAGDPGTETKSRRAVGNYLITYMGT